MKRALLTIDLLLAALRQLPLAAAAAGTAVLALIFVSMLDRPVPMRAVKDVYPLFEVGLPLIGVFLAAGAGARDVEGRSAETVLTYPVGYPRLILARAVGAGFLLAVLALAGATAADRWYLPLDLAPLFWAAFAPATAVSYLALLAGTVTRSSLAGGAVALAWWAGESIMKEVVGHCLVLFASACSGLGPAFIAGRMWLTLASLVLPPLAALWASDPERVYLSH